MKLKQNLYDCINIIAGEIHTMNPIFDIRYFKLFQMILFMASSTCTF